MNSPARSILGMLKSYASTDSREGQLGRLGTKTSKPLALDMWMMHIPYHCSEATSTFTVSASGSLQWHWRLDFLSTGNRIIQEQERFNEPSNSARSPGMTRASITPSLSTPYPCGSFVFNHVRARLVFKVEFRDSIQTSTDSHIS